MRHRGPPRGQVKERYGKLQVVYVEFCGGKTTVHCVCDCGNTKKFFRGNLESPRGARSCGCLSLIHRKESRPLLGHKTMSEKRKKSTAKNYATGRLPKWMFT